jgi:CHAT domain-containing protein
LVGTGLNNLALLYERQGRYPEAGPLYKRALGVYETALGPEHNAVGNTLSNLAGLYHTQGRYAEAEPLSKRAFTIAEKALGPDHPNVGIRLNNLAELYRGQGRYADAEPLYKRALAIAEKALGPDHPDVGNRLNNLAVFYASQGRYAETELLLKRSLAIREKVLGSDHPDVGVAVSQTPYKRDGLAETSNIARLAAIDERIGEIDQRLKGEFADYAALSQPETLSIAEVQSELSANEALVLFLDTPEVPPTPEETFLWVITKADHRWVRLDVGTKALTQRVAELRCGLDRATWNGEGALRCADLLKLPVDQAPKDSEPLPFDVGRAHNLYLSLFGQIEDLIKGKHLLIVPSGPLTQLPFQVLVTGKPDAALSITDSFRRAAWLPKRHATTVLPAVSSLKALRRNAKASRAAKRFVGFGNPLLDGPDGRYAVRAKLALDKQDCLRTSSQPTAGLVAARDYTKRVSQRGGVADVADIRSQVPLPETADELCAVARHLRASATDIRLGAHATESEIKSLSERGSLANYRVIHFATHGTLAGELSAGAEPGLVLTPPDKAASDDDGYLTASEIAGLKLDADWVILSACNTAAGGAEGAEALSGLARAFFYAGARAVLVSHWAVHSDSTAKLIANTVGAMTAHKTIGRSEALRRSMLGLIDKGEPREAHPSHWAPFVVVGEGNTQVAPKTMTSDAARPSKRPVKPNWQTEFWRQ